MREIVRPDGNGLHGHAEDRCRVGTPGPATRSGTGTGAYPWSKSRYSAEPRSMTELPRTPVRMERRVRHPVHRTIEEDGLGRHRHRGWDGVDGLCPGRVATADTEQNHQHPIASWHALP